MNVANQLYDFCVDSDIMMFGHSLVGREGV